MTSPRLRPPAFAALLLAALGGAAAADQPELEGPEADEAPEVPAPEGDASEEAPWSRGVSPERRAEAQRLLDEGNDLFLASRYREAMARYEEALRAWDHPAIRFNLVRVLIQLERPVEAYENLEAALRYGAAPLEDQVYREARSYERLLRGQLAEIEVRCAQEGVVATLDGEPFLTCPGARSARVRPGRRTVVGTRTGFLTESRVVIALPGRAERVDLELVSLERATVFERRWVWWKPWAVAGGGAAAAAAGVLLQLQARAHYDQYGDELRRLCDLQTGCRPEEIPEETRRLEARARRENRLAVTTMVIGGGAFAAGLVWAIVNSPRPVAPEPDEPGATGIAPALSPESVGVVVRGRF